MRDPEDYERPATGLAIPASFVSFGAVCWIALWASINTGPWNLKLSYIQQGWQELFNGVRAAFPLVVLTAWLFHLLLRQRRRVIRSFTLPEALWLYYGLICLVASVYTNPWFDWAYWGFAYLSAFAATEMFMQASPTPEQAGRLNQLNWLLASAVLIVVVWVARGQLFVQTSAGISGYGVVTRVGSVAGMVMVRASGISRLAAVPAIIAFAALWYSRGFTRIAWAAVFAPSAYIVWVMQSRGSLVSFLFALSFIMILLGGRARRSGFFLAAVLVTVFLLGFIPGAAVHNLYMYATRGTQGRQLASMSGRTHIFHEAWQAIKAAPFIGYGPQADRQISTIGNAQNGVLYALLCGGFLGGAGYVLGLLVTWFYLLRLFGRPDLVSADERLTLIQVAGIMAFFTLRSYPENCAALFSVDLMLQLPAIVYVGELNRSSKAIISASHVQLTGALHPSCAQVTDTAAMSHA